MIISFCKRIIKKIYNRLNKKDVELEKDSFEILEYISKYKYVFDKKIEFYNDNPEYQDCIWQYWAQGLENIPTIVKKCFNSVDKYCCEKKVIRITDENIKQFIEIPNFIEEKLKAGIISKTHFSDYLRTCLLSKYGGTWIDATVMLSGYVPNEILTSDFFVFKPIAYSEGKEQIPSIKMLKLLAKIPTYLSPFLCCSSWFIHSKANSKIMLLAKTCIEEYWKNEIYLIDYFLYHYFLTFIILNDNECAQIFSTMPNISNRNPHLLQNILLEEFDIELFNEIKNLSNIHKLSYYENNTGKYTFLDYLMDNN